MTDTGITAAPAAGIEIGKSSLVGRRLGEFVIREELSSGGFGTVYRAEQPALAREAVIKVLHRRLSASEPLVQRFLREARVASRLDHPYAAHIYAFGAEPDGILWIAMELVRGTPLDKLLAAQGPLPLERFAPLLERLCQVVQTAHDQGIVHRDIKPANVMVLARAGQLLPKLLDLGIAKHGGDDGPRPPAVREALDDARGVSSETEAFATTIAPAESGESGEIGDTMPSQPPAITPSIEGSTTGGGRLTEEGAIMGSPLYMAPEQWTDAGTVDARTDIYALGVLCHEALTNKPPFDGLNRFAIAMAHARDQPPPLGERFPPALDAVVARALAKRPADRYASALELAAAFRTASGLADELRTHVLATAPRPIAHAVANLEAARNAHQARDALWQLVRVVVRMLATIALSAHSHVGAGGAISESSVSESLRKLRRRAMPDAEWLALARELATSFRALRDAYPIPELVDFFTTDAVTALSELVELRDASDVGAADDEVRELLVTALPHAEQLLRSLEFLAEYRLVVTGERGAEVWMGTRRGEPPTLPMRGAPLAAGQPALADATGTPVISLWPFVQCHEPAPGVTSQLFFFEGKGRRGARLVALPEKFEHEDDALWEVLGGLVGGAGHDVTAETGADESCPYPGLASFTAADAGRFFGRERETETVVNRLYAQALLAVVGPSGAGKSSFIQAGIVPSLPEDWHVVTLRPGPSPLASLASRLASAGFETRRIETELAAGPDRLGQFLRTRTTGTLLIVVDQLEELFTLCEDAGERARFVEVLVRAARAPDDPIRVVFTLRDDFLLHAEALPALRSRLALALHLLTTPSRDELLRILDAPLRQAGYELDDPALAGEMVDALAETRSALALLSFTASKLWEVRDRRFRQLSRKAYVSLGGVGGALARHAESTLEAMPPEEQRLVREVFRHAVTAEGTRATLSRAELGQVLGGDLHGKAVVEKLVTARLLVVAESAAGGEQIEITHEALIDAWPRLVTWRREDAEGARLRDQLRAAARQWEERGRPTGLLWRGDALSELRLWRSRFPGALTDIEAAFAAASTEDASRSARRRRTWIAVAFATLVAGLVALVLLNARVANQRSRAEASQRLAEVAENDAKSNAEKLRANLLAQYEDQGRRRVIDGEPHQALVYLRKAEALGASGPAHDLLVAFAVRILRSKILQVEHDNIVKSVRFASDARFVTASEDGRARIWDAREGKRIAEVAHAGGIVNAELVRDEELLVTASLDGTAGIWDVASGQRLHALSHGTPLQAVLVSANARSLATIGADDIVRVWDLETGAQRFEVGEPHQPAGVLSGLPGAFSPDGARLAVGDNHGVWRVWDATRGTLIATGRGHQMQINTLRFSSDGRRVVTASNDNTAAVWDAATGKRLFVLAHADRVNAALFGPGDRFIVTASNDRTAMLWDAASGARRLTLEGHGAGVNAIAVRPDGHQLATVSDDTTAILWDATTGRREARLLGHGGALLDVQYEPGGATLITAGEDSRAIVWHATSQIPTKHLVGHRGVISTIAFAPDGLALVTAGSDGTSRVWDLDGRELFVRRHDGEVQAARFSPDGKLVASGGADTKLHVWNARTGESVETFVGHTNTIRDVAWHPAGTRLVSASRDGTARIWTRGSPHPRVLRGHEGAVVTASWNAAGDMIVTASQDNTTRLWSADGAEIARRVDRDVVRSAAFDATGTLIASSTFQTMAKISRVSDGAVVAEMLGHASSLQSAQWSPDDAFVVTASIDATARIWDAKRGDLLAILGDGRSLVYAATYSPDGRSIATASDDVATIWKLPPTVAEVRELLRCEVPFDLAENRLVRVSRPRDCTPRTP